MPLLSAYRVVRVRYVQLFWLGYVVTEMVAVVEVPSVVVEAMPSEKL